ncbi:proteasome subunit alpha type-7-like [Malania oleifera]|uniref:proteasome subunit alpha type-7-like n=1 Tax=Malania oleifera TaxID=397392 RepID=UPI0025ADFBD6|nr:proteasome subunit alpha type-7-like [Malania oleifera]
MVRKIVNLDSRQMLCWAQGLQQKYTQSGGVKSFDLSTLCVGFDPYIGIPSLHQVVESGGKNIEVAVMTREHGLRQLDEAQIDALDAEIEAEKAAAEATKKGPPKET